MVSIHKQDTRNIVEIVSDQLWEFAAEIVGMEHELSGHDARARHTSASSGRSYGPWDPGRRIAVESNMSLLNMPHQVRHARSSNIYADQTIQLSSLSSATTVCFPR